MIIQAMTELDNVSVNGSKENFGIAFKKSK